MQSYTGMETSGSMLSILYMHTMGLGSKQGYVCKMHLHEQIWGPFFWTAGLYEVYSELGTGKRDLFRCMAQGFVATAWSRDVGNGGKGCSLQGTRYQVGEEDGQLRTAKQPRRIAMEGSPVTPFVFRV